MTKKPTKAAVARSLENLKAEMALAVESANTMRERVQHALVGCVSHWAMTGSNEGLSDLVNLFIEQLGQGVNLKAVKAWCEKHLHMQEDAEGKKLLFKPVKSTDLDTKAAANEKWWSLKPQTVFSFDIASAIISLAKKAAKASEEQTKDPDADVKLDDALMEQLAQLGKVAEQVQKA